MVYIFLNCYIFFGREGGGGIPNQFSKHFLNSHNVVIILYQGLLHFQNGGVGNKAAIKFRRKLLTMKQSFSKDLPRFLDTLLQENS